ncbi:metal-dependent hydrolase [Salinibacter ruber]|uniref:metal-dependent hydrolase n=1 Tax=Salinibacter ruber TaxID=146919 RepID=UPI002168A5E6|nr:metal-dependent hydrolase [Salinibacter ruber]MCS3703032.1 inner membrane protein [Salinibacter ruber]
MDSVTQITLGAAVGEATAGREAGLKAPLWGAAFGLLPDLDVLANPFLTELQALTMHRSVTHSLVFIALVSACAAYGLRRFHRDVPVSVGKWGALVALTLGTHVGLDCLTTYGTQVFWPFSNYPVVHGAVFIIDPLYTVPLAAGLLVSLRWNATASARRWANYAGLALSSAYLVFTVVNKEYVRQVFDEALSDTAPHYERLFTSPTPFNNLLWQGVAETEDGYYVGDYSLLDPDRAVNFQYVPKQHDLLADQWSNPVVRDLRRFSRGYFVVRRGDGALQIHDLRFGRNDVGLTDDGEYLFTYRLQQGPEGTVVGIARPEPPFELDAALLRRFLARIQGQSVASLQSVRFGEQMPVWRMRRGTN